MRRRLLTAPGHRLRSAEAAAADPGAADAGAAALEYIAALLVSATVGALVLAGLAPAVIPERVSRAICTILHVGQGGDTCGSSAPGGAGGPGDEAFKPAQCKIREDSEKAGSKVTIGWFSVGKEYGFIRQQFSDGKIRLTAVDSASIGAAYSGKDKLFDIGKLGDDGKGAASVDLGGGLKFGYGSTWQFDDATQEKKFRGEIDKYLMQQQQMQGEAGLGVAIWNSITNNWADPPDPTITFAKTSLEASAKGALGVKVPTGPAGADGKVPTADPNLGVSLSVKGEYEVLMEKNASAGTTSWTYQLTPSGKVTINAVVGSGEISGKSSGAFKVTRDSKGQLVSMSFISTREGGAQASLGGKTPVAVKGTKANGKAGQQTSQANVTVTTLPLDNAQDRAVAQRWLSGTNEQLSSPFNLTFNALVPDQAPPPGNEFDTLMYEKARVSQTTYDNVTDLQEFGAEVNLGFKLGFSISMENGSSVASSSSYLGAPAAGGTRPMLDFAECS